ncbi:MAG TPA: glycosyltransferase [Candidatus Omnitrophica bacterium]|mgnify:CR=1 FL=1|nr:MAG: glycosyltransferase [Candidatus Omnitrophota bacterium]RKY34716.1 MAG: glycosyltransferase [Candidatus Omnitrophota bacterium]RKY43470.1 MAG: glycosyltransferase [Candidatus Omnitrophota bacterium]HEC69669.1 glycosyltransferase [Candidatus Omnitrophota bacterium]
MEFSVVVPIYNEENSLITLNEGILKVMDNLNVDYEVIYIDDGSIDSSLDILKEFKKRFPQIRIVSFKKNQGQSSALFAGFKEAKGKWIITLDADLQNPPQEILKLIEYKEAYDFITGVRIDRKDTLLRRLSSGVAKFFRWAVLRDKTKDVGCSLRVFKREVIEFIPLFKNFHRFFPFLAKKTGFKIKEVAVAHQSRRFGKSKYTTFKRLREGFFDLIGLFWLKRRIINYEIKYRS